MYRVAVCDDETPAREDVCRLCEELLAEMNVPCEVVPFTSAQALSTALRTGAAQFDLLCLDICMDGKTGMELAHELRVQDDRTSILFISGSDAFLREGYSVRAIQYLSKPVRREELRETLQNDLRLNHSPRMVTFRRGNRTVALPIAEIRYVESREHGVYLHLADEERYFPVSLTEAERLLPDDQFCRCHNSFLVNMAAITELGRHWITLGDGQTVPVGRRFYERAQSQFIRYLNR